MLLGGYKGAGRTGQAVSRKQKTDEFLVWSWK